LEPDTFLLISAFLITAIFVSLVRIYFPFYAGYRGIKKLNDRKRMQIEEDNSQYMRLHFSTRPTVL
jgi:hypothetical protein